MTNSKYHVKQVTIGSPDYLDGERTKLPKSPEIFYKTAIISNQLACVQFVFIVYYILKDLSLDRLDYEDGRHEEGHDQNHDKNYLPSITLIYKILITLTSLLLTAAYFNHIPISKFCQYYSAMMMYSFIFTPILLTLTRSISSDTVLRLIVLFLFLYLVSYRYFHIQPNPNQQDILSIYSANFATLAVIFMISRFEEQADGTEIGEKSDIPTNTNSFLLYDFIYYKTFALVILSTELLLLWPIVRDKIKNENFQLSINLIMVFIALFTNYYYSLTAFIVSLCLHLIIYFSTFLLIYFDGRYRDYELDYGSLGKLPILYTKLEE